MRRATTCAAKWRSGSASSARQAFLPSSSSEQNVRRVATDNYIVMGLWRRVAGRGTTSHGIV
jgi:hypothetical protein